MLKPQTTAPPKRRLALREMTILVAVYALDFSWIASGDFGFGILGGWLAVIITLAAILLYAPRSWELPLIALLIIASLAAVLHAAPSGPAQPPSPPAQRA